MLEFQKCDQEIKDRTGFWIEKISNNTEMKHFRLDDQPE